MPSSGGSSANTAVASLARGPCSAAWPGTRGCRPNTHILLTRSGGSLSRSQVSALSLCVLLGLAPGREGLGQPWPTPAPGQLARPREPGPRPAPHSPGADEPALPAPRGGQCRGQRRGQCGVCVTSVPPPGAPAGPGLSPASVQFPSPGPGSLPAYLGQPRATHGSGGAAQLCRGCHTRDHPSCVAGPTCHHPFPVPAPGSEEAPRSL